MKRIIVFILSILLLTVFLEPTFADTSFKLGTYLRIRHEYWKNLFDFDSGAKDNRSRFRVKSSLSGQWDFNPDLSLFAKLTNEFNAYPYYFQSSSGKKQLRFDIDEVCLDNLYLDVKNLLDLPLDLRFGRQDFANTYGEGFLIMDGTPMDGSRTFYFNALKSTWHINEDNDLDFVYINNPRDDLFLPVINEAKTPQRLNITDEEAYMLYLKNKAIKDTYLEGYYIYKREDSDGGSRLQSQEGIINTFGSFVKYNFFPYTLRSQLAYQFGEYGVEDRQGVGGYIFLDRSLKEWRWSPSVSLGYIYLSGDDPASDKNEGWDPLFSRWPWFSELYSLSYNGESGLDYWTNLNMWRSECILRPTEKTTLFLGYNFLRANETPSGTSFAVETGKKRGHLYQTKLSYTFNKNVSTYFLVDYFVPRSFYSGDADSSALFLRTELTFKF